MANSFKKNSPCPNCGGYAGAYKKENRCKGFVHEDGEVFFCRVENDTTPIRPLGFPLWRYPMFEREDLFERDYSYKQKQT